MGMLTCPPVLQAPSVKQGNPTVSIRRDLTDSQATCGRTVEQEDQEAFHHMFSFLAAKSLCQQAHLVELFLSVQVCLVSLWQF
jgi:hypothetical protein